MASRLEVSVAELPLPLAETPEYTPVELQSIIKVRNVGIRVYGIKDHIRTPDLGVDAHDRFAGLNVQNLKIQGKVYTSLTLSDVLTDVLSGYIVWALGDLRGEDTGVVAREELGLRRGQVVILGGVVRDIQVTNVTSWDDRWRQHGESSEVPDSSESSHRKNSFTTYS